MLRYDCRIARQMLGSFGYRFIADELPACGVSAGENKAVRLCFPQRPWSTLATVLAGADLAARHHQAPHRGGKGLPLSTHDVYSNRIAGYSMNDGLGGFCAT